MRWRGAGRRTTTRAPPSGRLLASTVPPCSSTTRLTIESPRPVPPSRRVKNGSKARARASPSKPGPSSSTEMDHQSWPAARVRRAVTATAPAPGACWKRVLEQVAEDLVHAAGVQRKDEVRVLELHADRARRRGGSRLAGSPRPVQERAHVAGLGVQRPRLAVVAQVVHEARDPLGALAERRDERGVTRVVPERRLERVEVDRDPVDRVPDLVDDAADEGAERLLGPAPLRDVRAHPREPRRTVRGVPGDDLSGVEDPDPLARAGADPVLGLVAGEPALEVGVQRGLGLPPVLGVDPVEARLERRVDGAGLEAEHLEPARAPVEEARHEIPVPESLLRALERVGEALLARAQGGEGFLQRRDVA